ncbi:MAG: F0F1 ATP synthase subunit A [Sneathiellaceae bacterium]
MHQTVENLEHAEAHGPLEQFEITHLVPIDVGGMDFSFTNSAAVMIAGVALVILLMLLGTRSKSLVPGRLQSVAELAYEFVAGMVRENVGDKGRAFLPFFFTQFMFILFANMVGLVPFSFTSTSHIVVTFSMAIFVFVGVTVIALVKHGFRFFTYFLPSGVPVALAPIIVPIEVISYFVRPISLSLRLFANMLAGHIMLKVFAGFVIALGLAAGWLPLAFIVALTGLEFLIAFLQAYVFTILTCLYLHDAIHLEH